VFLLAWGMGFGNVERSHGPRALPGHPGQIVRRRLEHELLQVPYPAPELLRVQYFMTACAMPQGASVRIADSRPLWNDKRDEYAFHRPKPVAKDRTDRAGVGRLS
jgi:hypothetical protein